MKIFFTIAIIIYWQTLFCQQPSFIKYKISDLPYQSEFQSGFTGDSLYISFCNGEIFYFNGVDFIPTSYPNSNGCFLYIYKLKKGTIIIKRNGIWYRNKGGNWEQKPQTDKFFYYKNILYGFDKNGIYSFDENQSNWKLIRNIPDMFDTNNMIFTLMYNKKANKDYVAIVDKKAKLSYNFIKNIIEKRDIDRSFVGMANNYPFYLNNHTGEINWGFVPHKISTGISYKNDVFSIPKGILKEKIDLPFSLPIREGEKIHFFKIDTTTKAKYCGTLDLAINRIAKISDNNYIISSFSGIFRVNPYITYYSPENSGLGKNIHFILSHNGKIFAGGYGSGMSKQEGDKFVQDNNYKFNLDANKNILPGAFSISANESWFFREGLKPIVRLKNNSYEYFETIINNKKAYSPGYYIDTLNNGQLAFGLLKYGLGLMDSISDDKIYIKSISDKKGMKLGNVLAFDQDKKNRIWMGRSSKGIAVYDLEKDTAVSYLYKKEDLFGFGAVSMTIDNYDQLWLGTNKGLYIVHDISDFDIYNNNIFSYAQYVNLPDNDKSYVFSIKKVKNKLVVANAKSINIIPLRKYPSNLKNVEINQLKYGFDINGEMTEQNAIYFDEAEYLWVGVRSGILRIDFDMLRMDTTDVELKFDYIKNGGLDLKLNDNSIRLDPLRRNLHIAISPERNKYLKNNILYEYILTNKGGDTILNHGRTLIKSIETGYLNPGNYNLKLIAYKNGKEKDKKELNIIVPYTFLENPLTLPLGISFSLFAISMILFYRKEQNKKMARKNLFLEKIKNEKEQLKVQAILNNFNPHFINNSLNWVQARYYEDQDMTKMIGRLSENINYIFNKTQKTQTFHSLKEEFHLINNYIEIQKLRFGQDNINLQKPEDDDILHKIDVIVMQVLIHVENAVEHGLRNRAGSNQIIIKINEDEKYYYIVIIDDGAGRKRAKEIGSKGLQSGLNMLKSIYSIYNANPNNRYKIKTQYIDDIFTYRNEKFGTKVILSIPKEYIFDINF